MQGAGRRGDVGDSVVGWPGGDWWRAGAGGGRREMGVGKGLGVVDGCLEWQCVGGAQLGSRMIGRGG